MRGGLSFSCGGYYGFRAADVRPLFSYHTLMIQQQRYTTPTAYLSSQLLSSVRL